jgi:polysaccharide biosynthesis protein PslG
VSRSLRRLSVLLALVAALLAIAPAAAQARLPSGFIGLTAEDIFFASPGYRNAQLSTQASARVRLIRQSFDWRAIETSPGVYDLRFYDRYVLNLAARGIRVLPILFNAPSFHNGTTRTRPTFPPRSNSSMARFAQVLVRRYGPQGTLWAQNPGAPKLAIGAWQIWNEPNLPVYWRGRPNARSYAKMVSTVGGAIRKVDRRAEIVSAGLPPSTQRGAVRLTKYITQLYRARLGRSISSLAINAYARNSRELGRLLKSVRKLINRRGGRRDKLWITELGWATSGPRSRFRLGVGGQARQISSSYSLIRKQRRRLGLRGVVYFSWKDLPRYAPLYQDLWGLHAGLLNANGTPKRGFHAFKSAVGRIR